MNIDLIRARADGAPFRPFLLEVSSGAKYQVVHPDYIIFGREIVVVIEPNDLVRIVDAAHVVAIEDLKKVA